MSNINAMLTGSNRRSARDRRAEENGPPSGCCERRKRAERRLPSVEEGVVSEAEWFKRMACFKAKLKVARLTQNEPLASLTPCPDRNS